MQFFFILTGHQCDLHVAITSEKNLNQSRIWFVLRSMARKKKKKRLCNQSSEQICIFWNQLSSHAYSYKIFLNASSEQDTKGAKV